ncbi:MAG: 3-hydroxyacyl-[acyl-carrier-protein] dehydratase [Pirellulaceae bacterium]|jgi:3-hydroxyacyl-[acyl-carrier-protein] dehydratase
MRWFLIDRFTEFISGQRASAIKCVALAEEYVVDYIPSFSMMPTSLIVEGMAQTGGLLVSQQSDFKDRVVLAKVGKAAFHRIALPGDTITYSANVEDIRPDGSIIKGTCCVGDELLAEIDIVFAHLDDRFEGIDLFDPAEFLRMLRTLNLFEVGRTPDGEKLSIPAHLLAAEQALFPQV